MTEEIVERQFVGREINNIRDSLAWPEDEKSQRLYSLEKALSVVSMTLSVGDVSVTTSLGDTMADLEERRRLEDEKLSRVFAIAEIFRRYVNDGPFLTDLNVHVKD